MRLIRDLNAIPKLSGSVVTIGNFDGIHLGHQKLLNRVAELAKKKSLPAVVITFEPLPDAFFNADTKRLSSVHDKLNYLKKYNLDYIICIRFNASFANQQATTFINNILLNKLAIAHLIIGDDFVFGHDHGDYHLLRKFSQFQTEQMLTIEMNGLRISSTHIRELLKLHDFARAKEMLGRPYTISGKVAHGDKRGRVLGFPTANIYLRQRQLPLTGVFACKIHGLDQEKAGVANIGIRPTFDGHHHLLEVHIFDFTDDIYGRRISVEFVSKLRDETPFASFAQLATQIKKDVIAAKNFLYYNEQSQQQEDLCEN